MEQVNLLLTASTVVTMDEDRRLISPGAVAVRGNEIVAVGPEEEITQAYQADETIRCNESLIIPGLINTHAHMPMSLLRGLADDLRLDVWLYGYILPVEKRFVNPEFCYLGTLLAAAEQIRSGVTCFADMYYFEEDVAWAAAQAGMRAVCGETLMKFPSPDADSYDDSLAYCREFLEHFRDHELIVAAPAPHSVYMTTPELLTKVVRMAQEFDVPVVTHVSETKLEVTDWLKAYNMPPVVWMEEQGVLEAKIIAAHCVHVNDREIGILANRGVGVAHNPTSNLKLASGIAPVKKYLQAGVKVSLGVDGSASNDSGHLLNEARLALLLQRVMGDPAGMTAEQALWIATRGGAQNLGRDDIGQLAPGMAADVAAYRLDTIDFAGGLHDPMASLTFCGPFKADFVVINGKVRVQDGQLIDIDLVPLVARHNAIAKDLVNGELA